MGLMFMFWLTRTKLLALLAKKYQNLYKQIENKAKRYQQREKNDYPLTRTKLEKKDSPIIIFQKNNTKMVNMIDHCKLFCNFYFYNNALCMLRGC